MLAVPNFSEGRDRTVIDALVRAATAVRGVRVLDRHADPDHHRSVLTLDGEPDAVRAATLAAARAAVERIDLRLHRGIHPRVGAIDVAPFVYRDASERGAACAAALVLADDLGHELELPVFLYGPLADGARSRAGLRRGGPQRLQARIDADELTPDFGPRRLHPRAGAVLVAARPPLVAINFELAPPADRDSARRIAALIRDGGAAGLPRVRALGLTLAHRRGVAQVSVNIEDPVRVPIADVLRAISAHARVTRIELVGLAPAAAFDGLPAGAPLARRRTIEDLCSAPAND